MNAPEVLERLTAAGVRLTASGGNIIASPKAAVTTDVVNLIREHKPELLAALASDALPGPATEARRQKVLAMLAERPELRWAVITDTQADLDAVILTLAIRGRATCELAIPKEKYAPFLLLDLIEKHGVTIH